MSGQLTSTGADNLTNSQLGRFGHDVPIFIRRCGSCLRSLILEDGGDALGNDRGKSLSFGYRVIHAGGVEPDCSRQGLAE